jgi:hypothetical protein
MEALQTQTLSQAAHKPGFDKPTGFLYDLRKFLHFPKLPFEKTAARETARFRINTRA